MKTLEKKEKRYFMEVGFLMAVLGISFIYYMGNSLYYASQKLFEELVIECVELPDLNDIEEFT